MCDAYKCNICTSSECANRQSYNIKTSAIFPYPVDKGESILQIKAMHKCFVKSPNMRAKALQKVYEIMCGSKFMYGDGVCWLEGWKISTRVTDGVLLNQLIKIIITIITVL
jgi:hypothetical protein